MQQKTPVHNGINFVKLFEILDNDVNPVTVFFGDDTRNYQLTVFMKEHTARQLKQGFHIRFSRLILHSHSEMSAQVLDN